MRQSRPDAVIGGWLGRALPPRQRSTQPSSVIERRKGGATERRRRWWPARLGCQRQCGSPRHSVSARRKRCEPPATHSSRYCSNEAGAAVPGLSSFPNSSPHDGQTSYHGAPSKSSYGGVRSVGRGGGHSLGRVLQLLSAHTGDSNTHSDARDAWSAPGRWHRTRRGQRSEYDGSSRGRVGDRRDDAGSRPSSIPIRVSIPPWVDEDHLCADCAFAYTAGTVEAALTIIEQTPCQRRAAGELHALGARMQSILGALDDDAAIAVVLDAFREDRDRIVGALGTVTTLMRPPADPFHERLAALLPADPPLPSAVDRRGGIRVDGAGPPGAGRLRCAWNLAGRAAPHHASARHGSPRRGLTPSDGSRPSHA